MQLQAVLFRELLQLWSRSLKPVSEASATLLKSSTGPQLSKALLTDQAAQAGQWQRFLPFFSGEQ